MNVSAGLGRFFGLDSSCPLELTIVCVTLGIKQICMYCNLGCIKSLMKCLEFRNRECQQLLIITQIKKVHLFERDFGLLTKMNLLPKMSGDFGLNTNLCLLSVNDYYYI